MVTFMQNENQYVEKTKAVSEDAKRQLEQLQKKMDTLVKQQQSIKERQDRAQNKINKADRVINKTSKELKDRATVQQGTEAAEYVYDDSLYSVIEGCYLKDTELAMLTGVNEDLNSVATGTSDPNATNETPKPVRKDDNRAVALRNRNEIAKAGKEKAQNDLEASSAEAKENDDARRTTDALIKLINITTIVVSARPTMIKQIMTHYRSVLEKLVAGINEYNGVSERNAENKRYNEAQDEQERRAHQERLTEIDRNNEARRKKMSWLGRIIDTAIRRH
jgi:chromosome segregation ATPase